MTSSPDERPPSDGLGAPEGRRTLDASDRPDPDRLRRTPSADDGRVSEGEGAAEMDAEIERRETDRGHDLRATEFDIARLPPD